MTTPYEQNLPCLNTNCKSHGKPHPNCRCYGFAEGGEVRHFCSDSKDHNADCEYYMNSGGKVPNYDDLGVGGSAAQEAASKAPSYDDLGSKNTQLTKYQTPEQKIKTGLEQGLSGAIGFGIVPGAERLMGVDPEDIKGRAEANPELAIGSNIVGTGISLYSGYGEAAAFAKAGAAAARAANLGKIGSAAINSLIQNAGYMTENKITDAILNKPGSDPEALSSAALLHTGADLLTGTAAGTAFQLGAGMIGKGLADPINAKVANKFKGLLEKLGEGGEPLKKLGSDRLKDVATVIGGEAAEHQFGLPRMIGYPAVRAFVGPMYDKIIGKGNELTTDVINKCLATNNPESIPNALYFIKNVSRGVKTKADAIESIFSHGNTNIAPAISNKSVEALKKFIEDGQTDQQMQNAASSSAPGFAEGGMVNTETNHFANAFPEQNILLSAAKGRISGYLNSIRPMPNQPKLPFDKDAPQTEKHRSYNKAVNLAVSPMSIFDRINKGDLTPEDVGHFKSLYPDVHNYLSQEMTERITRAQLKGESPPYKKRQAMSLFLGAGLDSTFTPASIAMVQGLYAMQKAAQQQAPQKNKKGTASISKASSQYMTDDQAREKRMQNQK